MNKKVVIVIVLVMLTIVVVGLYYINKMERIERCYIAKYVEEEKYTYKAVYDIHYNGFIGSKIVNQVEYLENYSTTNESDIQALKEKLNYSAEQEKKNQSNYTYDITTTTGELNVVELKAYTNFNKSKNISLSNLVQKYNALGAYCKDKSNF